MAEKTKKKEQNKVEKKAKKSGKDEKVAKDKKQQNAVSAFTLLADDKTVDSSLASLFAVKQPPVKLKPASFVARPVAAAEVDAEDEDENDAELSELDEDADEDLEDDSDVSEAAIEVHDPTPAQVMREVATEINEEATKPKRKRKRKDADNDIEDAYMSRLAREEDKEAERLAVERAAKRQKQAEEAKENGLEPADTGMAASDAEIASDDDSEDDVMSPPPKHETEITADAELTKANRTVFLGNVSTAAISSKSSRKTLLTHLASFFDSIEPSKEGVKHKVESIRFRSTPYASAIPKKAAFAKKELMDATTKSTNAYVVYSTEKLAREATKHLNGTVVLGRHLRVDSVAHPAKIDNRRCVFVGNLGFVDDESNIQDANEEDGREKRKRGKEPADIEEGLWRSFSKCGSKIESVRVIRDSTTRVGKGIAYVQFEDENAVEAALLLNEKKFPPMLPRKLRVSRAKAPKKNAKPGTGRPSARPSTTATTAGYKRKISGEEASRMGRTSKLLGRAAAAKSRKGETTNGSARTPRERGPVLGEGIKKPENFIFEGHRASRKQGKTGLKLGGKKSNKSKVTSRSASFKKARTKP